MLVEIAPKCERHVQGVPGGSRFEIAEPGPAPVRLLTARTLPQFPLRTVPGFERQLCASHLFLPRLASKKNSRVPLNPALPARSVHYGSDGVGSRHAKSRGSVLAKRIPP